MCWHLADAERLFMDETTAPVLDPGRGRTKRGYFWAVVSDDRGHGGTGPPIVLFRYAPGRSGVHAETFLDGFRGRFLQCDGYDGYDRLTRVQRAEGPWTLVHCWSHLRRRFVKLVRNTKSPIAETALRHSAAVGACPRAGPVGRRGERAPPGSGGPAGGAKAALGADRRGPETLVREAALDGLLRLHPGRRHPLCPRPLDGSHPIPRRRPSRTRHHSGRERHPPGRPDAQERLVRSEEHTSELQSLMRISYPVFC